MTDQNLKIQTNENEPVAKSVSADTTGTTTTPSSKPSKGKSWERQAFSKKLNLATVMAAAARNEYMESLAKRGIDEASIGKMEELVRTATETNNRQEILKGELRKTTDSIDTLMTDLGKRYSEIKKTIKLAVPHPEWKKFGFDDVM